MKTIQRWSLFTLLCLPLLVSLVPSAAQAQWSHNPYSNVQMGYHYGTHNAAMKSITTDSGASISVWHSNGVGEGILYGQLVNSSGQRLWSSYGAVLASGTSVSTNPKFDIVSDGGTGFFLVREYIDNSQTKIHVARFNSSAQQLWDVEACLFDSYQNKPQVMALVDYMYVGLISIAVSMEFMLSG